MAGRFEGMSGTERKLSEDIFPGKERKGCGMHAARPRKVLNPPLFIFGDRLPTVPSSTRRAMGIKKLKLSPTEGAARHSDGRLEELQARILGAARNEGLTCWRPGAVGGSFSLRKRRQAGGMDIKAKEF